MNYDITTVENCMYMVLIDAVAGLLFRLTVAVVMYAGV